jgi:choice-of-anchor B domain-containing protein
MIDRKTDVSPVGWVCKLNRLCQGFSSVLAVSISCLSASAAELNFNVTLQGSADPVNGTSPYGDVWGEGDYAYLGTYQTQGVRIFNIADPTNPTLVATYQGTGGVFKDVKTRNGIGYFASDSSQGMHIVDLSDPANPTLIKKVTSADGGLDDIHNIYLDGDYVYQADNHNNVIKVLDISDPANPTFVRNIALNTPGEWVHDITVQNGRLYTSSKGSSTTSGGTTHIYDVSNIGTIAPQLLKSFTTGARTHSNAPSPDGNTLVVGQERDDGQLRIYDISNIDQPNDPDNPVLLKTITRSTLGINAKSPHNPVFVGDKLFVSWYQAGLTIFDLSDPSAAPLIGVFDSLPGTTSQPAGFQGNWGVYPFLGPDKILLSDTENGLLVVDASILFTIEGDLNGDGFVGVDDLNVILNNWNQTVAQGDRLSGDIADFGDGFVGVDDLNVVLSNWNQGVPPAVASLPIVPEPGTLAIIVLGASTLLRRYGPKRRSVSVA